MSQPAQDYANHGKLVPGYHLWCTALLMLPTLYFGFLTVTGFSLESLSLFLFAVGVTLVGFYARAFPLGVQDRVIRLEERLRMERLHPDDLRGRIDSHTTEQLVGLRFASDAELPLLARRVLDEGIADRKVIKQAVQSWRSDHQRI